MTSTGAVIFRLCFYFLNMFSFNPIETYFYSYYYFFISACSFHMISYCCFIDITYFDRIMTTKDSEFFPRPLILLFTTYVLSSDYMPKMVLGPGGTDFYLNKTKKKKKFLHLRNLNSGWGMERQSVNSTEHK